MINKLGKSALYILGTGLLLFGIEYAIEVYGSKDAKINKDIHKHKNIEVKVNEIEDEE